MTDMDVYGDFTESDQAGIPGTMYRFLDLVNVSPEFQYYKRQMRPLLGLQQGEVVLDMDCGLAMNPAGWPRSILRCESLGWTDACSLRSVRRGRRHDRLPLVDISKPGLYL